VSLRTLVSVDAVDTNGASEADVVGVLIAGGDNLRRKGLRAVLETEPDLTVVGCAADGDQAVALARQMQPDVVLVDIALRGVDGPKLARRLAAHTDTSGARVLILSVSDHEEEALSALRAGASGFLLRDVELPELVRAVRTVAAGEAAVSPGVVRRMIRELAARPEPALPAADRLGGLTAREREVMTLVAAGLSNEQIAEHLVVSHSTARTHVGRALGKLRVHSRAQLVTLAYETGLVLPGMTAAVRSAVLG
jgi:DNA-binding NarL/FixJ family response regulator